MELKFAKGMATPDGCVDLCRTCKYGLTMTGHGQMEQARFCNFPTMPVRVYFRLTDCSRYYPATLPWKAEMEEVAWLLRSDEQRRTVGFVSPAEWKKEGGVPR
ncbi:MAG: hypothetical protein KGL39_13735 [Patescibacteria group bacterium]|nr:hypothetical protein [Patescibacteria group bacterium]